MKLLPILVCAAVVSGSLAGCDSTGPKTVTRTVVDTVYQNDRFARNAPVVDGEWTISTATDTANAFFFQDSDSVSAYLIWKKSPNTWILTGNVTDSGVTMHEGTQLFFSGKFTNAAGGKKTGMNGFYVDFSNISGSNPTWSAVRQL
jgi:hypothetical protein